MGTPCPWHTHKHISKMLIHIKIANLSRTASIYIEIVCVYHSYFIEEDFGRFSSALLSGVDISSSSWVMLWREPERCSWFSPFSCLLFCFSPYSARSFFEGEPSKAPAHDYDLKFQWLKPRLNQIFCDSFSFFKAFFLLLKYDCLAISTK